ncbi:SpdD protein [Streptomyces chitinivorans]|uniref:SpdD protein n=1 Tax=Streptomyces chitinivorans TaxID=1257027 RepID=A0ABW7HRH3_9ACTN|nr:SpdD protein [Streptomyces chitinivorans]MDH2410717.1 SpdD protein [Streptomyces chitinivorans]
MFLRPQLPTTPHLPTVAEHGQQPACSCHSIPARRPVLPPATTGAVAAVLVGGVVLTALLAAVAVTAISVAVAALVLRSLLTGGHRR